MLLISLSQPVNGIQEADGSIPFISTKFRILTEGGGRRKRRCGTMFRRIGRRIGFGLHRRPDLDPAAGAIVIQ
jgi:hypothetical protein